MNGVYIRKKPMGFLPIPTINGMMTTPQQGGYLSKKGVLSVFSPKFKGFILNKLTPVLLSMIKVLAVSYVLILVLMYFFQRNLLYFPTPPNTDVNEQTISFTHQGETLNGWVLNPGKQNAILYFGGNAEKVEKNTRLFNDKLADHSVYLINYRGYGQSTGEPTEQSLFADALYIYDQLKTKHQTISAMGRSLGTGVASHLAANRAIHRLVLVTPFDSITNVAQGTYWFLPVSMLIKDKYASWQLAGKITAKTLVFIAAADQVVPPAHAKNLVSHFTSGQVQSITIKEARHGDISYYPQFKWALVDFLTKT